MIDADKAPAVTGTGAELSAKPPRSILVIAGDLSGEQHAAKVINQLKQLQPDLHVWGVGGPEMSKAGAELLFRSEDLAILGFFAIAQKLPLIKQMRDRLLQEVQQRRPECVMLVDYGGFNLRIAAQLHERFPDLPLVYFICPQVWGSRPGRIKRIQKNISKVLVIFPFEIELYQRHQVEAHFVGHPVADKFAGIDKQKLKEEFCARHSLSPDKPIVGIFPGSRVSEVKTFTPMLMQAVTWLRQVQPDVQFVMSQANPKLAEHIYAGVIQAKKEHLLGQAVKLVNSEDNAALMSAADILWTKSGTTTLEAAMLEKPMLVFYKGDWLSFFIVLLLKRVKYVALPNLLAGKMLVPELIQLDCRAEQLVRYTRDWLEVPAARRDISQALGTIRSYLCQGDFAANAAAELNKTLRAGD